MSSTQSFSKTPCQGTPRFSCWSLANADAAEWLVWVSSRREDVGLVFLGPAVGHDEGRQGQAGQLEQQDEQRERGYVGKRLKAEHARKAADEPAPPRSTTNRQTSTTRDESRIDRVTWPSA